MRINVVVPALDEAACIGDVVRDIRAALVGTVIVVDNGSTDATARVALEAGARVVHEPRRGHGSACAAGVAALDADCAVVAFLDGDGSDPPAELVLVLAPIEAGDADFVLGSRVRGEREPGSLLWHQIAAGRLGSLVLRALYRVRYSDLSPVRAIRRAALDGLDLRERTYGWNLEMQACAARGGLRVREVPVRHRRRAGGTSKVAGTLGGSLRAATRIAIVLTRLVLDGRGTPARERFEETT